MYRKICDISNSSHKFGVCVFRRTTNNTRQFVVHPLTQITGCLLLLLLLFCSLRWEHNALNPLLVVCFNLSTQRKKGSPCNRQTNKPLATHRKSLLIQPLHLLLHLPLHGNSFRVPLKLTSIIISVYLCVCVCVWLKGNKLRGKGVIRRRI